MARSTTAPVRFRRRPDGAHPANDPDSRIGPPRRPVHRVSSRRYSRVPSRTTGMLSGNGQPPACNNRFRRRHRRPEPGDRRIGRQRPPATARSPNPCTPTDLGVAAEPLEAAASFAPGQDPTVVRGQRHPAIDDPLLIQRFPGNWPSRCAPRSRHFSAASQALTRCWAMRRMPSAQRVLWPSRPRRSADDAGNEVSSALFELCGTRSTAADLNLGHWRNA